MHRGVVALRYQGIGEPADPVAGAGTAVGIAELEAQLELVAAAGGVMDPRRATTGDSGIVLTFDGGERSVVREALPRLATRGWVAAAFVTTSRIGRPGYLAPDEVKALRQAGWLVGSHGDSGEPLAALRPDAIRADLSRSRQRLLELLGHPPADLALPGGRGSPRVEEEARALGFTTLWSGSPGVNAAMLPDGALRRTAIRPGEPPARFARLIRGDTLTHAADRLDRVVRDAIRRAPAGASLEALADRALATVLRR